jgi:polyadenylate-binding protein
MSSAVPVLAPVPFQSASLYAGNLSFEVTEGFLFELFNRVGPVASIRVCRDTITRRSLGYAYVNFHNVEDAERALDTMNFTEIKGKPCRIMWSQRDPTLRKSGVGNVFVKNLAPTVDNKGLFDVFSVFGNILSCKVATDENGASKGYGYVHYETAEAAQEAILKVNGMTLEDKVVVVGAFLRRQDRTAPNVWTNLYVKQFPESWTEQTLEKYFGVYGDLSSVKLALDEQQKSKRFGFVDFKSHESAVKAALELNGRKFEPEGEQPFELYVSRAQKKAERAREMRFKIEAIKVEQINKFQGMNLYVKNIDDSISDEQFKALFAVYGTITSARIMREESTGAGKGFAFVCYSNPEEANRALAEMSGKMILGKPLFVAVHQRKEIRRAQLAAAHASRGLPRYPMGQAPLPYPMYGPPGQMAPRPPFPMMPNMMAPRGPPGRGNMPPPFPSRGYPMPQYGMGMPVPGPMQGMSPGPGGFKRGGPMNMPQGGPGGRRIPNNGLPRGVNGFGGRGMPPMQQPRPGPPMKYNNQVRNQPQGLPMGGMPMNMGQMIAPSPQMQILPTDPLDHNTLALADPQTQKNLIGEKLYPMILQHQPHLAGKITGMLLEMDNAELLHLLESPEALLSKTAEALAVLQAHQASGA